MNNTIAIIWQPEELNFLRKNYYSLTNAELLKKINSNRGRKIKLSTMLSKCKKMGLSRGIQIRWSTEDINYLKANYKTKGDKELAIDFNKRKKTYRIIDGKKVYRKFTKKHVEKKRSLLGLIRKDAEVLEVRRRNNKLGLTYCFTSDNNRWESGGGSHKVFPEGTIRMWINEQGKEYPYIKIDGNFIPYAPHFYKTNFGPIPDDKVVFCVDGNHLNPDPDNWKLINRAQLAQYNSNSASKRLSDNYIAGILARGNKQLQKQILASPELINLKRNELKLRRKINECND